MYYLTMGAIFRSENSWLEEWIQYHLAVGIEHFILYNDDQDTRVSDRILQPYVDRGIVENIHVSESTNKIRNDRKYCQQDTYYDAIKSSIEKTHWLALIDLDEFILPRQQNDVRAILEKYDDYNGLAINWAIFGSNGHIKRPPTQINHLLRRSETNWEPNRYIKSIIKPKKVIFDRVNYDAHYFHTEGGETVNENYEPVSWMAHAISTEKIRINHYVLRSWQDFWEVKAVRARFGDPPPCDAEYFEYHDRNDVFDDEISRRYGHIVQNQS